MFAVFVKCLKKSRLEVALDGLRSGGKGLLEWIRRGF